MSADTLSVKAREFYEFTKGKLVVSIILGAATCTMLARAVDMSGFGQVMQLKYEDMNDDTQKEAADYYMQGYGFGTFFLILGFLFLLAVSLFYSPYVFGTNNEKETLKTPMEDVYAHPEGPVAV
jgi:hypothetical protein